jgi:hypothetical protein
MTYRRHRQPASDKTSHAVPRTRPFWLRRDSERCQSGPTWNRKIVVDGWFMATVVEKVSTHNRPQPLALFGEA